MSFIWANNLPLKYDDHPCIERDEIVYLPSNLLIMFELEMRRAWKKHFDQLFDAFCAMAVNALKTKNDTNDAVKAGKGKQHAKENATLSNSDLRHAVAAHFDNIVANISKVEEFNSHFFNYLDGN